MNEYDYAVFTPEMKHTHKILVPMMINPHFSLICQAIRQEGYDIEILETTHSKIADTGLHYTHNDMCYPAILVIGQFIDALKSGKYNPEKTALLISQTGGGCRASNYIHLLRKALKSAGYPNVPVISMSTKILDKKSGFRLSKKGMLKCGYSIFYGDFLFCLYNQARSYEIKSGESAQVLSESVEYLKGIMHKGEYYRSEKVYSRLLKGFEKILLSHDDKPKVGIVGEIYMKYSPLGNNELENFLIKEGTEPVLSGLLDFLLYCIKNRFIDKKLYNIRRKNHILSSVLMKWLIKKQNEMIEFIKNNSRFNPPDAFDELDANVKGIIGEGVKMGEGWLLTAEMVAHIKNGATNIVCAQPFGCLPNHIVAKGVMGKVRELYPAANIVAIDYDPSASHINQENRLKLMLMNANIGKMSCEDLEEEQKMEVENRHIKEECLCS